MNRSTLEHSALNHPLYDYAQTSIRSHTHTHARTQVIYLESFLWSPTFWGPPWVHLWSPPFGVHLEITFGVHLLSPSLESTFAVHLWSPPLESTFRVYHLESTFGVNLLSPPLESIFWSLQSTGGVHQPCTLLLWFEGQTRQSSGFPHKMLFVPSDWLKLLGWLAAPRTLC